MILSEISMHAGLKSGNHLETGLTSLTLLYTNIQTHTKRNKTIRFAVSPSSKGGY